MTFVACQTHVHSVGKGAQGNSTEVTKQWWILWGLVPINNVDTKAMAGGANDYTITTTQSFIDAIISGITGIITVNCRTVEVKK